MNLRKHIVLVTGCGIALVVAIAAAVLLIQQISAAAKAQSELNSTMARLDKLNKRKPYPNKENVALSESNLVAMQRALIETQTRMRAGQLESEQIERAQFPPLLERTIRQLNKRAEASSVSLPPHFAFGFESYSAGALPATGAVSRLVTHLKTVASLCNILYMAKITNIISITRDEFETSLGREAAGAGSSTPSRLFGEQAYAAPTRAGSSPGLKDIPVVASNELYSTERFAMEFSGRENAVWEALNALVKGPPFCIIRDLSLENSAQVQMGSAAASVRPGFTAPSYGRGESPGMSPSGTSASGVSTNLLMTPREERVVAGRELVRATVVVDVCQFAVGKGEPK